jgi:hypothetical protein
MPPFIHRCPNTGFRVQGWTPDLESGTGGDVFVSAACLACGLVHFVNPKTGRRVGESDLGLMQIKAASHPTG